MKYRFAIFIFRVVSCLQGKHIEMSITKVFSWLCCWK